MARMPTCPKADAASIVVVDVKRWLWATSGILTVRGLTGDQVLSQQKQVDARNQNAPVCIQERMEMFEKNGRSKYLVRLNQFSSNELSDAFYASLRQVAK